MNSMMPAIGVQGTNSSLTLQVSQKPANWLVSSHDGQT
jgi:hypothetical protein